MNKEFIKKMIKAKKFEYDAIKELMPDFMKRRIKVAETDTINLLKDIALEMINEEIKDNKKSSEEKIIKKLDIQ